MTSCNSRPIIALQSPNGAEVTSPCPRHVLPAWKRGRCLPCLENLSLSVCAGLNIVTLCHIPHCISVLKPIIR